MTIYQLNLKIQLYNVQFFSGTYGKGYDRSHHSSSNSNIRLVSPNSKQILSTSTSGQRGVQQRQPLVKYLGIIIPQQTSSIMTGRSNKLQNILSLLRRCFPFQLRNVGTQRPSTFTSNSQTGLEGAYVIGTTNRQTNTRSTQNANFSTRTQTARTTGNGILGTNGPMTSNLRIHFGPASPQRVQNTIRQVQTMQQPTNRFLETGSQQMINGQSQRNSATNQNFGNTISQRQTQAIQSTNGLQRTNLQQNKNGQSQANSAMHQNVGNTIGQMQTQQSTNGLLQRANSQPTTNGQRQTSGIRSQNFANAIQSATQNRIQAPNVSPITNGQTGQSSSTTGLNMPTTVNTNSQRETVRVLMETGWYQEISEHPMLLRQILNASRNPRIALWIQRLAISNIMEEFIDYIEAFVIITNTELRTSQNELIIRLGENDLLQDLVENPAILVRILNYVQNTNHIELIVSLSESGDIEDLIPNPNLFSQILNNAISSSQIEVIQTLTSTDNLQSLINIPNTLIQILRYSSSPSNAQFIQTLTETGGLQQIIENPSLLPLVLSP